MDGILEQILAELKEIKELLADRNGLHFESTTDKLTNDTMKSKEAAEYLGIAEYRLRVLTKQGKIRHFTAGNKYLYKRRTLDQWLEDVQAASIIKAEDSNALGKIRKVQDGDFLHQKRKS